MQLSPLFSDLSKAENIQQLASVLAELAEQLDVLYTETAPNGAISSRQGRIAIYKNGSSYETWQNTDGAQTWQRIDQGAVTLPFQSGDLIISTVTTARTGWTNVSATYSNKFMRVNTTPVSTGGADTHTHAAGSYAGASHTHLLPVGCDMTQNIYVANQTSGTATFDWSTGNGSAGTHTGKPHLVSDAGGTGTVTGTSASGDNVPAYVTVTAFKKD